MFEVKHLSFVGIDRTDAYTILSALAELLFSIFHSFKAEIANAISSFKWMKNVYIYEK